MTSRDAHDAALLFFSPHATADSTSSHVHDIDIDRRNQTNHASSFVLASGTPFGHLLWHPHWINSSVEVLGHGATDSTSLQVREHSDASNSVAKSSHASFFIGDFNSKVGCVIAVCVSCMFTMFYLMSICLTPLNWNAVAEATTFDSTGR